MSKIDKNFRLELFVELFLKTFPMFNVCLYGHPVVIRCEITIYEDDIMMKHAVEDFKKIFMVDHLEIKYSVINDRRNLDTLSQWTSDELAVQVMYTYEQMFPCSFILNMFTDDNASLDGKKVIVVPTVKVKESTIVMLEAIIKSIDPSSELARNKTTFKHFIDCIVDNLDEQCSSEYLPKAIKFNIIENNTVCNETKQNNERKQTIVIKTFEHENKIDHVLFLDKNDVKSGTGTSTLSGVIRSYNDYFIFTAGHKLNKSCKVDNKHYSLKEFMWPGSTRQEQVDSNMYFQSNISTDAKQDQDTVSDVAVLEPSDHANGKFFKSTTFHPQKCISTYNEKRNPVLPNKEQIEGTVQYKGYMTKGEMTIVGTAYIGRECQYRKKHGGIQSLTFYERLYVATPVSLEKGECSEFGDSGACCTMEVEETHFDKDDSESDNLKGYVESCHIGIDKSEIDEGGSVAVKNTKVVKIHSYLKAKMPKSEYRLLSPAHFVLEQMRKITNKPDAVFVSLPPSQLEKSINHITKLGSEFKSSRGNLKRQQNKVEFIFSDDDLSIPNQFSADLAQLLEKVKKEGILLYNLLLLAALGYAQATHGAPLASSSCT